MGGTEHRSDRELDELIDLALAFELEPIDFQRLYELHKAERGEA